MGKILCKIFIDNLGITGYNGYNRNIIKQKRNILVNLHHKEICLKNMEFDVDKLWY